MYYGTTQTVLEASDFKSLRALSVERSEERTLVHLTVELRPDKVLIAPERASEMHLFVTDGNNHVMLELDPLPNEEVATLLPDEVSEAAETMAATNPALQAALPEKAETAQAQTMDKSAQVESAGITLITIAPTDATPDLALNAVAPVQTTLIDSAATESEGGDAHV